MTFDCPSMTSPRPVMVTFAPRPSIVLSEATAIGVTGCTSPETRKRIHRRDGFSAALRRLPGPPSASVVTQ